jgi:uncharacterized protein YkwD
VTADTPLAPRRSRSSLLAPLLVTTLVACGAGASNGAKMGEALAFATVAAATQIALDAAESKARSRAALQSSTVQVTPQCDNQGDYACVSIAAGAARPPDVPEHEMSLDEAHDYVLGYVNGIRKLNHVAPVVRDAGLEAFALEGSEQLAQDHRQNQHMMSHAPDLAGRSTELQGSPEGIAPRPLEDQLGEVLVRWVGEGPGGIHHDAMLRPEWHKLGVGIVPRDGRTYFTVDFLGD